MLCYIADAVRKQFGGKDVYRVGGDEYVAFATDVPEEEIKRKIEEIRERVTEAGYHAAMGYEYNSGKNVDIDKLIVSAESKMYKDKADFYKDSGRNHR